MTSIFITLVMESLKSCFYKYKFDINRDQINIFYKFLEKFKIENKKLNLSSIRDDESIILKHFIDSLMILKFVDLKWKIADIWTGWWFPWLPLKIYLKDQIDIDYIDWKSKKIRSLKSMSDYLNLNWNFIDKHSDELIKDNKYRNRYDYILVRAVWFAPKVIKMTKHLLKKEGTLILYKKYDIDEINVTHKFLEEKKYPPLVIKKYFLKESERVFLLINTNKWKNSNIQKSML